MADTPSSPHVPQPYIVESLLPLSGLHLIYGPAASGTDTLLLQILRDWTLGEEILGHSPGPVVPFAVVDCYLPVGDLRAHMRSLGMDPSAFPHVSMQSLHANDKYALEHNQLHRAVSEAHHACRASHFACNARAIFFKGLAALAVGRMTDDNAIQSFLAEVLRICEHEHVTFTTTMRSAKSRGSEGYAAPLERIMGSTIWTEKSHSKIGIEFAKPADPSDPARILHLNPYLRRSSKRFATLEDDGIVIAGGDVPLGPLDAWLAEQSAPFTTAQVIAVAGTFAICQSKAEKWLKHRVNNFGTIVKLKQGHFAPKLAS